jgi:hypothetical protein
MDVVLLESCQLVATVGQLGANIVTKKGPDANARASHYSVQLRGQPTVSVSDEPAD